MSETKRRKAIGERVRAVREGLGWTQTELAKRAERTKGTISRLEAGIGDASISCLMAVAVAMGVSTDYLLAREGSPPPSIPDTFAVHCPACGKRWRVSGEAC
jgi:transcriptional regulator with XRE-family HTH domain